MSPQEGDEARPLSALPQPLLQLRRRLLLVEPVPERLRLRQQVFLPHALAALLALCFVLSRRKGIVRRPTPLLNRRPFWGANSYRGTKEGYCFSLSKAKTRPERATVSMRLFNGCT